MDTKTLNEALEFLGSYLQDKGLKYEIVAIGGGALLLLGYIIRPTRDLDVVALKGSTELISASQLPPQLLTAIQNVGSALKLPKDWVNSVPASLWEMGLPEGFEDRLERIDYKGLILHCASRFDQICFKLYAYASYIPDLDSKHLADLKLLNPTKQELEYAEKWCKTHDVSEGFAQSLTEALQHFGI